MADKSGCDPYHDTRYDAAGADPAACVCLPRQRLWKPIDVGVYWPVGYSESAAYLGIPTLIEQLESFLGRPSYPDSSKRSPSASSYIVYTTVRLSCLLSHRALSILPHLSQPPEQTLDRLPRRPCSYPICTYDDQFCRDGGHQLVRQRQ